VLRNRYRGETPIRRYHAAFLRRRSRTAHRPGRFWPSVATALGRHQLTRQKDERRVVQRVVSGRARSAPQEGHESRQAQPTHWCRLQRNVDEQNGNRYSGKVHLMMRIILNLPSLIARRMVRILCILLLKVPISAVFGSTPLYF